MRVLFSTTANEGHFRPLVSLAQAVRAAGHEVRVAAPASYAATVEATGLAHLPFDDPDPAVAGAVMSRLPTLAPEEADATVVREIFGRIDAQAALPALRAGIADWAPDLVVREPAEYGALAAAVAAGVPHAQVAIGVAEMTRLLAALVEEPLRELSGLIGAADDAVVRAEAAEPVLTSVPRSLDQALDPQLADDRVVCRYREDPPAPGGPPPVWGDPDHPLVYVTFGSVTGSLPPFAGVFREAVDALADVPVRVLLTTGRRVDLDRFGPVPPNTRVEAWRPQAEVFPHAAVVLHHGGFGTTMGAAAAGIPQIVAPIFTSDQRANARHVAAFGAGRAAPPGPDVVHRACAEVPGVLADPTVRVRAAVLATDIAALPPVDAAAAALARLVAV